MDFFMSIEWGLVGMSCLFILGLMVIGWKFLRLIMWFIHYQKYPRCPECRRPITELGLFTDRKIMVRCSWGHESAIIKTTDPWTP